MHTYADVLGILAFFGSFWLAVTTITVTVLTCRYWQRKRTLERSHEIVMQMLHNKMPADEIERVLLVWSQDKGLAKKVLAQSEKSASKQFATS